ncbi:MAG: hypothetical protein ACT4P6_15160 [Gemmatimonadaceae bacterium]
MLPTLRLGFVVAPAPLHGALRKAKFLADWHTAVPMQAAAAQMMTNGSVDQAVVQRAHAAGVAVLALSHNYVSARPRPGLLIGYGAVKTDRIAEGLRRLSTCR